MIGAFVGLLLAACASPSMGAPQCGKANTLQTACPDVPCLNKAIKPIGRNGNGNKAILQFKPKKSTGCSIFENFSVENLNIAPKCTNGSGTCKKKNQYKGVTEGDAINFEAQIIGGPQNCRARICMFFMDDKIQRRNKLQLGGAFKGCVKKPKSCNACRRNVTVTLPKEWCLKTKKTALKKIKNRQQLGKQLVRSKAAKKVGYYSNVLEGKVEDLVKDGCRKNVANAKPWQEACDKLGLERVADVGAFVSTNAQLNAPITDVIKEIRQAFTAGKTITDFAIMEFDNCPAVGTAPGPPPLKRGDGKNGFVAIACGPKATSQKQKAQKPPLKAQQPTQKEQEAAQKLLEALEKVNQNGP